MEDHEKQLREMTAEVEKREKKEAEVVSKVAHEVFVEQEQEERKLTRDEQALKDHLESWVPKTQLGKDVLAGKITSIDEVLAQGRKILESEVVDLLLPHLSTDVLFIGQAKGKFGGGKRRAFRQTQKKTKEGNILTFGVMAVVGDRNGHIGIGYGRAAETFPAKEKAIRQAKLNIMKISRGCGSYNCSCDEKHSVPLATEGKCSSVRVKLIPASQGTGLVVGDEMKKILRLAGVKDVYSKTYGGVQTTFNTAKACMQALAKLGDFRQ